jgi:hypothetical protein
MPLDIRDSHWADAVFQSLAAADTTLDEVSLCPERLLTEKYASHLLLLYKDCLRKPTYAVSALFSTLSTQSSLMD